MKNFVRITTAVIICVAIIISCKTTKSPTTTTATPPALTYTASVKKILDQNCNGCHNNPEKKKGDFTKYAGVKAKIDKGEFQEEVFQKKSMPPKEPLSADDFDKLKKWVEAGAPE
ncbi:MAG: cytochrome c [Bacteroidia bacterium]|nr:cytochrome c [Bacteroidia bacterium]